MRLSWTLGLNRDVAVVFWAMSFVEAAFGAYIGVWPLWIERLGAPITVVGLVIGASGILRLGTLAPSAWLGERFGTRPLILAARTAAGLGMLAAAAATHWTQLFAMVVGSAIGELAFPLAQAHVAAHAGEHRVRAYALVFTVGPSIALILSPLVSGALVAVWGIRAAFVFAALCTAASLACFALLRRGPAELEPDTREHASSYREAVADAGVRRLLTLQAWTIFALALGTSLLPTFLEDVRGLAPARIATLGAGAAVGSALFGLAVTRLGPLQRAPFVAVAIAVASTVAAFVIFMRAEATGWIVLAFVCRGGLFSAWSLFAAAIGEIATARHRARSFALSEMAGGLMYSLAPMLAGPLYGVRPTLPMTLATLLGIGLIPWLLRAQRLANRETRRAALAGEATS